MQDTQELLAMARKVKENTEKLLAKHYEDNSETIKNAYAWKASADADKVARGHLYALCSKQGDIDMNAEERADIISESVIIWSQVFGYVNSPKTKIKHLPLVLFPFQKNAIRKIVLNIERGSDILIEKSREMGVSWLVLFVFMWYWLFRPGSNFLLGSYKEKLVDDGTIDSMFGKIRYIVDGLPKWILPKGFKRKDHDNKMKLHNPALDNYITGDTMNPNFGRGSRKTAIFFDELGFWDYGKAAWESSSETTDCRIGNSTPNGYNYYKMLIDSGLDKIRLHWSEHPLKDTTWYNYKVMKETKESVAQEIDISYDASRVGVIYGEWKSKVVKGEYPYDPSLPLYVSWDFGNADGTAIIWAQVHDGRLRIVDAYYKKDKKLIDFFVPFVTGKVLSEYQYSYTDDEMQMINEHATWKGAVHFGDPAGNQKHQNMNFSVIETLAAHGIKVNVDYKRNTHNARQSDTQKLIMRGIEMNRTEGTQWLDVSMLNYSFSTSTQEGVKQVNSTAKPKHDQYSHMATSFEYMSVGLMNLPKQNTKRVVDKFSKGNMLTSGRGRRRLR